MLEVERKLRSPGNEQVIERLTTIGAEKVSDETHEDVYFIHPCRRFKDTDEALRLRELGGAAELTYKGPRMECSHAKAREEVTIDVGDTLSLRRILERLGFTELATIRKRRVSFALDKLMIAVDDVEGIGQFVEIELMTEDPSRAKQLIDTAMEGLLLGEDVETTYLEMFLKGR